MKPREPNPQYEPGRRKLLRGLLWLGGLAVGAVALPARFWRRVSGPAGGGSSDPRSAAGGADIAARIRQRARPFRPDVLDEPHDLAG